MNNSTYKSDYAKRIYELKCSLGIGYKEISEKIGRVPQNFYDIMSGKSKLSSKLALEICNAYPQISFNWLMFGEGEMIKGSAPMATASNNSTAVAGHNNTVNTSQQYVSNLISIIQKRDEQIDRLLTIIEDITAKK